MESAEAICGNDVRGPIFGADMIVRLRLGSGQVAVLLKTRRDGDVFQTAVATR